MTSLTVTTSPAAPATLDVDVVVVAARQGADGPELVAHPSLSSLHAQLAANGYTGGTALNGGKLVLGNNAATVLGERVTTWQWLLVAGGLLETS